MKWFDGLSVMNKLLLSFAVVIVITACVGGTGVMALSKLHGLTEEIGERHMDGLYWIEEANKHKLNTDLAAANLTFADDAGKEKLKQNIVASLANMHRALDSTRPTLVSADGIALFDAAVKRVAAWEDIVQMQIGAKPMPVAVDQMGLIAQAIAASEEARGAFERLAEFKRQRATDAQKTSAAEYESMRLVMISLVLGSIVAAAALATRDRAGGSRRNSAANRLTRCRSPIESRPAISRARRDPRGRRQAACCSPRATCASGWRTSSAGISDSSESILMASRRNRAGQHRSVAAHRGAGGRAAGNGVEHAGTDVDREAERRERAAGGRARARRVGSVGARQRPRGRCGRNDARVWRPARSA